MLPFDTILFDVGGVLLTNGWDHRERTAAVEAFHLDKEDLENRHADIFAIWERGGMTMEAYLSFAVFHQPRDFSRGEFIAFMLDQSRILPDGAIEILRRLSSDGRYLLGALNNEARETNEYRFKTFELRNYFDVALSSCYMAARKPDEAIYRRAMDIVGGKPDRILFIDDREENLVPAKAIGMATLLFKGADGLRQNLANLGVL